MKALFLLLAFVLPATSQMTHLSLNGVQNPSTFGQPSNLDATQTTGSIAAGSTTLTLASAQSFAPTQGVLVAHAGHPCGQVRGTLCPAGPTPTAQQGSGRPTRYQAACIDGLGGIGRAGTAATLNSQTLTLVGMPGCIAVAVYRNGALIALQYAPLGGSYTFADTGQVPIASHRDLPLTPPAAPLADNLPALIRTISGSTANLSTAALTGTQNARVFHSDSPLVQAAIDTGSPVTGDQSYRVNYPVSLVDRGGSFQFALLCDTGDICLDTTGQYNTTLNNVSLNAFGTLTQPSTIGLYCARDARLATSQFLNTNNLFITLGGAVSPTGHGSVSFYNYGCEIENHIAPQFNAEQLAVLTCNNLWNVHSPFRAEVTGSQSMSQVVFEQPTGGSPGAFWTLENAYSVGIYGGYNQGANPTAYNWAFELHGNNGDLRVIGYRTEYRGGFAHIHAHGSLGYSTIDYGLYRTGATTPAIQMDDATTVTQLHFRADDYGASGTPQAIYACATQNCSFLHSQVDTGYWQTFDQAHAGGVLVHAVRDGSLTYNGIPVAPKGFTGEKTTGACTFHIANGIITSVTGC